MKNQRKKLLKEKLAEMISIAWGCDDFDPEVKLSDEDIDYIENKIERITDQLYGIV